jgi:hypothetical protein
MLNVLINVTRREYLNVPVFLAKGEKYTDAYVDGKGKLLKAAINLLLAREARTIYPNCTVAGSWYGYPVLMDIFTSGYRWQKLTDVTQDVFATLYNNGYRGVILSMMEGWADSADQDVIQAIKLMKEGRYSEFWSLMEHSGSRDWTDFFAEFAGLMIIMESSNEVGGK